VPSEKRLGNIRGSCLTGIDETESLSKVNLETD